MSTMFDLIIGGILRGGLYVLMAMGLSLVFGVMNISNFAHGEFYMLGAYFAFFASTVLGANPILCVLIAALGGFICGVIMEKLCFYPLRKRSTGNWVMNSFLVTCGLSFVLQNLAQAWIGVNIKGVNRYWEGGISIMSGMTIPMDRIMGFVIAMLSVGFFWLFFTKTRTGNSIRAVSEHEVGATLVGINLNRIHTLTFALSCMLAAIAGAALLSIAPAHPNMGMAALYKSWTVVILVGLGNIGATLFGGLLLGMLETISIYSLGAGWQDLVTLVLIIIVLIIKPSGLFGKAVKGVWER
jgi:branched-chain amino acid transport system permease protein